MRNVCITAGFSRRQREVDEQITRRLMAALKRAELELSRAAQLADCSFRFARLKRFDRVVLEILTKRRGHPC